MNRHTAVSLACKYTGVIVLLAAWEGAPRMEWIDSQFVPPLSEVLQSAFRLLRNGDLFVHVTISLWRVILGMVFAIVISIPAGIYMGYWNPGAARLTDPLCRLLSQVNPFSLMPVFILFFGMGEAAKLAMVGWVCIWPILAFTITGIRTIDPVMLKTARTTGLGTWDLLSKVLIPGAAPGIFQGLQRSMEISFFMLIAGEMIGASSGLGYLMHNSSMNVQIPRLYAAGLVIVLTGLLLKGILSHIQARLSFWKEAPKAYQAEGCKSVRPMGKVSWVLVSLCVLLILAAGTLEAGNPKDRNPMNHMEHHNHSANADRQEDEPADRKGGNGSHA